MARRLDRLFLALAFSVAPRAALAQAPVGAEFAVHTFTSGIQYGSRVASDAAGNFIVAWGSELQDGSGNGIFARRYDAAGEPEEAAEFQVNSHATGHQQAPAVASDPTGWTVVVWESEGQDGNGWGIFGQRFDSGGARLGPEFRVNTFTTGNQRLPSVSADAAGGFVVAWSDYRPVARFGVFARRYDPSGFPLGPEFRANSHTTGQKDRPAVAMAPDGHFVVVWDSELQDPGQWAIVGQRFDPFGAAIGAEFRVNTYTTGTQYDPAVAADHDGNFVVVWTSEDQDGSYYGVFGQRYDRTGAPRDGEFQVNQRTTLFQIHPDVSMHPLGDFVVVWQSSFQDGNADGIVGRRFGTPGHVARPEFPVNTYTTGAQVRPSAAMDARGDFVVVWQSLSGIGTNFDAFGQRFTADLIFADAFEVVALAADR